MTNVYQAIAPTSAEVSAVQPEGMDNSDLISSGISGHITSCWVKAKFAKQIVTERLLACERQRRGEYDPDIAHEIAETGGSDIYIRLTDVKCGAAKAWIQDVMFQDDRGFDLEPSREPEVPLEVKKSIVDFVQAEAMGYLQQGAQIHPDAFRVRMEEVHDEILSKIREEAKNSAERMANVIQDQLTSGGYKRSMEDFIDDFVTYPTAILKGPAVRKRKRMTWGPGFSPVVLNDFARDCERVSPYDIFPSPNSSGPQDGYLIQRHRLTPRDLENMRGVPGYSDEEIDKAIGNYGRTGFRYFEYGDQQRDNLEGKYHSRLYQDGLIEAIEFWGPVMGSMLREWGMKDVEENKVYEVNAWQVGSYVIKCVINPDPLGLRPYEIASWRVIPGAFWGTALPEIMRDVQTMCNSAARALANNMAVASGPQTDISVDRLADGEEVTNVTPFRIWQTTSDRSGSNNPAIRFFMPDMRAAELMGVFNQFQRQADEVTGVPNYVYGATSGGSGAGRTASGLSMLMDNASKGIKSAIVTIDHVVEMIVNRFYVHNMIYNPDPFIKGDFRVVARGAMGLIHKEQIQVRRNEFLAATANPVDMQIVGMEGRAYLLREMAKGLQMDTDKIVPPLDMLKYRQEQIQAAMQSMSGGQQTPSAAAAQIAGNGAPPPAQVNTVQPQQEVA